ncbi:MAG: fibronectin type III domain-containing protein [Patescibacteria group bacterium]
METKSLLNKRIPTILGLIVLFGALGAGVFFIGAGPGLFSPRATPQTTPKNVKITNITDTTFTVSFLTDDSSASFVKYGTSATSLTNREGDDRDQLAGNVGTYNTHHITLRNLQSGTNYFFTIGTSSNGQFDNNGKPYTVKTVQKASNQSAAQTIYGTVLTQDSNPADGSIVYVTVDKGAEMSALVRSSGTWAIPLSQLRGTDGGVPPAITTNTLMLVFVQGKTPQDTATLTTTVGQPQFPVKTITLGENNAPATTTAPSTATQAPAQVQPTSTPQSGTNAQPVISASGSASPTIKVSVTIKPTSTTVPSKTPTPTTDTDITIPATNAPKPISGSAEDTLAVFVAGLLLISFGGVLYLSIRK